MAMSICRSALPLTATTTEPVSELLAAFESLTWNSVTVRSFVNSIVWLLGSSQVIVNTVSKLIAALIAATWLVRLLLMLEVQSVGSELSCRSSATATLSVGPLLWIVWLTVTVNGTPASGVDVLATTELIVFFTSVTS